ncbi:MAG TPA: carboxypeptidase-like regulatory domain-containing protein, partial [Membranihabitans sp.]|nr:carboxypeptidase-like regulatory domain-containing protein [Membranihabitans sp.]
MRIILPFIYLCIVLTMPALAQDDQSKQIAGIVKDQDGVTLPGVSIAVVGSNQGTVSDENGEFTLQVARGDSLQFTYIGKKPETLVVDDRNILEMILYDDASLLQQVQVVAFGTQKKESVISSIESVNVADLKQPASNLTGALAGRIPG